MVDHESQNHPELEREIVEMRQILAPLDMDVELPPSLTGASLLQKLMEAQAAESLTENNIPFPGGQSAQPPQTGGKVAAFPWRRLIHVAALFVLVVASARLLPTLRQGFGAAAPSSSAAVQQAGDQGYTEIRLLMGNAMTEMEEEFSEAPAVQFSAPTDEVIESSELDRMEPQSEALPNPSTGGGEAGTYAAQSLLPEDAGGASVPVEESGLMMSKAAPTEEEAQPERGPDMVRSDDTFTLSLHHDDSRQWVDVTAADKPVGSIPLPEESFLMDMLLAEEQAVLLLHSELEAVPTGEPLSAVTGELFADYNSRIAAEGEEAPLSFYGNQTRAQVYSLAQTEGPPPVVSSFAQDGSLVSSQVVGGTLYLITEKWVFADVRRDSTPLSQMVPMVETGGQWVPLPSERILIENVSAYGNYLVVSAVPLEGAAQGAETLAVLGPQEFPQGSPSAFFASLSTALES